MKNLGFKLSILLVAALAFTNCGFAASPSNSSQGGLSGKINLQDASSVSERANKSQVNNPAIMSSPLYNATMSGVGNFMQGMSDNPTNVYSMQDQARQRAEYIRNGN